MTFCSSSLDLSDAAPLLCSYRAALAVVSFIGFVNMYALRVDMSVAMVCMINQTALDELKTSDNGVANTSVVATVDVHDDEEDCEVKGQTDDSTNSVRTTRIYFFYGLEDK